MTKRKKLSLLARLVKKVRKTGALVEFLKGTAGISKVEVSVNNKKACACGCKCKPKKGRRK